ncbi:NAD-dependent epimerase/dehydratase family protein [Pseudomonas gingeri]|uniref:NAD-dependent epimerase/dehydratase family protein n=1 Tax=Pseudomonas gingeri TaxID=117681 RepID=UPI0015A2B914|nr:NAD(P)-dependent oxidoreductase [Pseudomonas gingeri]NWA04458.1 NAD(P)-dependent oxidoreductase [Pseudomonas gingeri]NWA15565.1 NAD(P)-dependent oxidoreductase [Pseudomonas gingeri]NWA58263.1 NAD(P)-dependent oxidoreductase [Pseudomonas gingeri]NWA96061.1 NAD(P)-dependent oxidoreductase [Pseudomonas gingeri]NWB04595.1 NAD(P)-dependent oxidoreductase [Pseudomonas gingeri]
MRVLVTGATGFVGRHVVSSLIASGHSVIAVARDIKRAREMRWPSAVHFVACDIHCTDLDVVALFGPVDALIHLAWPGLPDYRSLSHFENTLGADYRFLKSLVLSGCRHVLVAGTCLEYGLQEGCLNEDMAAQPTTPYGIAKDCLRRFLEVFRKEVPFTLQWARLFYMYGPGQNSKSLLSQLELALLSGDDKFPMSWGEQLRDYLPVEHVAADLVNLLGHVELDGVVNICSGKPISVRRLVEEFIISKGAKIELELGHYRYPDYEPMAFWGDRSKYQKVDFNE